MGERNGKAAHGASCYCSLE